MGIRSLMLNERECGVFVVVIISAVLAIIAVGLRFVATKRAGRKFQLEDWLALGSLVIYLNVVALSLHDIIVADGRDSKALFADVDDYTQILKMQYAGIWLYFWQQFTVKLSLIALYYRIFQVRPSFRCWITAVLVYHVVWIVVVSILLSLKCIPLYRFWRPAIRGICIPGSSLIAITESINSAGDFLLVILAVSMISALQISKATKRRLAVFFGIGTLVGIIGFLKIGLSFNVGVVNVFVVTLWSNVQASLSLVCCCVPVYQSLVPNRGGGFWTRFTPKANFSSRRPSSSDQRQHWLHREDGSSRGLVWSDGHRNHSGSWSMDEQTGFKLQGIKVKREIEVSR
ncbi:hypothetical protein F4777DRAFT_28540 [Nemania sp. FL0916]|nr:hypothetical protein F4777DRAFT_28540 [Nemania sp. FL0916]